MLMCVRKIDPTHACTHALNFHSVEKMNLPEILDIESYLYESDDLKLLKCVKSRSVVNEFQCININHLLYIFCDLICSIFPLFTFLFLN